MPYDLGLACVIPPVGHRFSYVPLFSWDGTRATRWLLQSLRRFWVTPSFFLGGNYVAEITRVTCAWQGAFCDACFLRRFDRVSASVSEAEPTIPVSKC